MENEGLKEAVKETVTHEKPAAEKKSGGKASVAKAAIANLNAWEPVPRASDNEPKEVVPQANGITAYHY